MTAAAAGAHLRERPLKPSKQRRVVQRPLGRRLVVPARRRGRSGVVRACRTARQGMRCIAAQQPPSPPDHQRPPAPERQRVSDRQPIAVHFKVRRAVCWYQQQLHRQHRQHHPMAPVERHVAHATVAAAPDQVISLVVSVMMHDPRLRSRHAVRTLGEAPDRLTERDQQARICLDRRCHAVIDEKSKTKGVIATRLVQKPVVDPSCVPLGAKTGSCRGSNPGPPPPKGGIIPLDHNSIEISKCTIRIYTK